MKEFFIWVSISVRIKVKHTRNNSEEVIEIHKNTKVIDVLKRFDIKPDMCLTLINGKPVPIDYIFENDQILSIVEVSSGG